MIPAKGSWAHQRHSETQLLTLCNADAVSGDVTPACPQEVDGHRSPMEEIRRHQRHKIHSHRRARKFVNAVDQLGLTNTIHEVVLAHRVSKALA
jgi:hypothetical protein